MSKLIRVAKNIENKEYHAEAQNRFNITENEPQLQEDGDEEDEDDVSPKSETLQVESVGPMFFQKTNSDIPLQAKPQTPKPVSRVRRVFPKQNIDPEEFE